MATFNGAAYLGEQLDSLAGQNVAPCELVIFDDDSKDDTLAVCDAFRARATFPVHVHRQPQRVGYRRNFLDATLACTGDLIAFADQDDVWLPRKLELCANALQASNALLCYHNAQVVDKDLHSLGRLDRFAAAHGRVSRLSDLPHPWFGSYGFTQVLRRELLGEAALMRQVRDHNDADQHLAHDQWFFWLAAILGRVVYVDEPLALYRQHGGNVNGAGAKRSAVTRLLGLTPPFDGYRSNALGADDRAAALGEMQVRAAPLDAAKMQAAALLYAQVAQVSWRRHELYTTADWLRRAVKLARLWTQGAYRAFGRGGVGPLAGLRDLACTLVLTPGRLLERGR